jgi:osmotically inducible protein OsmC
MKRTASAVWQGAIKDGKGNLTTPSGVLSQTPYSYHTRFEDGMGTNPEELIAAAHAGCFTMALSGMLGGAGFTAKTLNTTANLTLENKDGGWSITAIHLDVRGNIPGIDAPTFDEIAAKAKAGCPVSRVLNATITMSAKLES